MEWHKHEAGDALTGALGPNQSGILALSVAKDVEAVKEKMPVATSVRTAGVHEATADSIKEAGKAAV